MARDYYWRVAFQEPELFPLSGGAFKLQVQPPPAEATPAWETANVPLKEQLSPATTSEPDDGATSVVPEADTVPLPETGAVTVITPLDTLKATEPLRLLYVST